MKKKLIRQDLEEVRPKPENKITNPPSNQNEDICFSALQENKTEPSSFPFMWTAKIADQNFVKCFVDSGCQRSLLKEEIFQKFPVEVRRRLKPSSRNVKSLSGETLPLIGEINVAFCITDEAKRNERLFWKFLVVPDLKFDVIIGYDILNKLDCTLNLKYNKISLGNTSTEEINSLAFFTEEISGRGLTYIAKQVCIQANCFKIIKAKLSNHSAPFVAHGDTIMFTPNIQTQLHISPSLCETYNNAIKIVYFNTSDEPLNLPRGKTVGSYEVINNEYLTDATLLAAGVIENKEESLSIEEDKIGWEDSEFLKRIKTGPLSSERKQIVETVLLKLKRAFATGPYDVGQNDLPGYKVKIDPDIPIKCVKQFPLPFLMTECLQKHINEMVRVGIIEIRRSEYTAPIFCIGKPGKDGKIPPKNLWDESNSRFLIDLRAINKAIKDSQWGIRRISEVISDLSNKTKFISTIDIRNGFSHCNLAEESQKYFSFSNKGISYVFKRVPQGSVFSPRAFVEFLNQVYGPEFSSFLSSYVDDLTIHTSGNFEEHLKHIELTLKQAIKFNLRLNIDKSQFFSEECDLLGFRVSTKGVKPQAQKLEAIKKLEPPSDVTGIRSFLGLTGYYRGFYHNYAKLAEPLIRLTRKNVPFIFGPEQSVAFEKLKTELLNPNSIFLEFPDKDKEFYLVTDASEKSIASILMQQCETTDRFRIVATYSKVLSGAASRFDNHNRELFALVQSLKHFQKGYLWAARTHIFVDCAALTYLKRSKDLHSKLYRIAVLLDNDLYTYHHISTSRNPADYLSRPSSQFVKENRSINLDELEVEYLALLGDEEPIDFFGIGKEEMRGFQLEDPEIKVAIDEIIKLENTLLGLKSPQDTDKNNEKSKEGRDE